MTKPRLRSIMLAALLLLGMTAAAWAQDRAYGITNMFTATDQGQVLANQPASGALLLKADGTYVLNYPAPDQGAFRFSPASATQPKDMIFFRSHAGYQYFAYVQGAQLMVWLRKTSQGANLYVNAVAKSPGMAGGPQPQPRQQVPAPTTRLPAMTTQGLPPIQNGRFSASVMYGGTSGPRVTYRDLETGGLETNEKGVVLRSNGTFALRAEFGNTVTTGHGVYQVRGNQVSLRFSDGSGMTMVLEKGGKNLNWYGTGGMLISEFFFMGVLRQR